MLAFISGLLLKEGPGLVSFVLIGKTVRLIQSINCITVYRNEFFSAFGAGCRGAGRVFTVYQALEREMGIFSFV